MKWKNVFISLLAVLLVGLLAAPASALDGYYYTQTIEYAACDQEIYQQDIVIHRSTGTAYNETAGGLETWHIYVGDHCREDYGDIRFTNSTGAELAYYLWPDYDSSSARVAVRLEGATSGGTLTVHYGNPSATTTSSRGEDIYQLFDHFKGGALDTAKWNKVNTPTVADSKVLVNSANEEINSKQTFGTNTILEGRGNIWNANYHIFGWGKHPNFPFAIFQFGFPSGNQYNARNGVSSGIGVGLGGGHTGDHTWAIHRVGSQSTKYYIDGNLVATLTSQVPTVDMPVMIQQHVASTGSSSFDYILVRAYSATPPAALTFSGEQETAAPPAAAFTATPTAGLAPLTVQFTDTSTGSPTSWLWDFGDGNTSTAQNPQHTYTAPGLYTVTLNATNEYGSDTETKTAYITVYGPVTAQFMADVTYGALPLTVQFTDASSGSPTSWTWDFGDGNTSTDQNPEHTYTSTGTYTVKLIASHPYDSDEETKVNYITVVTLQPFPGCSSNPTDPDSDGLYEDINGNGRWDFQDLVLFFQHLTWCNANQPITLFDWNSNFRCDFDDVHKLWLDGGMI